MIGKVAALLAERLAPFPGVTPHHVLSRDAPGGLGEPGLISANRHCRVLRARDGWIALNLAREDDRELVPALIGGEAGDDPWQALARYARGECAAELVARGAELQLPLSRLGEARGIPLGSVPAHSVAGLKVLDLAALWAGPLAAGLLAWAGADVVRAESTTRPDPTAHSSPRLDAFLNGGKQRIALDFSDRPALLAMVARADVVVTSGRRAALARLGLVPKEHRQRLWLAVTAHGWNSERTGFGDDCAVAGGLAGTEHGEPRFLGDALADPLTGVEGALAVIRAVAAGETGLLDLALAATAASYAQALAL